ncbi:MAG: sensor histidine kinase [Planctomycetaceae bacterium]|nr:sensor histidine kinase [Planctomycetaceae bacterium]
MFRAIIVCTVAFAATASADEPTITSARDLRRLSPERAAERLPVSIEATVIAIDPRSTVFVQDDTGGAYLNNPPPGNWERGMRLRITGKTYAGLYVPGIRPDHIQVIGTAALPAPTRVTAADLASGRWHYQYVELAGVVQAVTAAPDGAVMRVATGSDEIDVRVGETPGASPLVGAAVTVRGLAAGAINDRRQLVRPYLKAQSFADLRIDSPPDADSFIVPVVPVSHLMRFSPDTTHHTRVRVRGVVTYHRPGEALVVRDGADAVYARVESRESVEPGDVVEVVGFPRMGAYRAELAHAVYRKVGSEPPPDAVPTTPSEILTGAREADLVSLDAELVEGYATPDGDVLALRAGGKRFLARCPTGTAAELPPGCVLNVTGICRVAESREGGYKLTPLAFEVWPRSSADVRIVSRPSGWTTGRLLGILGVVAAIAAGAFAWAWSLRRQVRRQTGVIREQSRREAILDERQRIAREVHDTLEQELVGLSLRLEAAAVTVPAEGKLAGVLDTARRLVGRIHDEVRGLVHDLRDESGGKLSDAVTAFVGNLHGSTATAITVAVTGDEWPIQAVLAHNLKRVAQEAVTNALKHAGASAVRVELRFAADALVVAVTDDGRGFDQTAPPPAGHFGLVGMRERVRKFGGELRVTSKPGQGTTVEVRVSRQTAEGGV